MLLRLDLATRWKRSNKFICNMVLLVLDAGRPTEVPVNEERAGTITGVKAWVVVKEAARANVVARVNRTMMIVVVVCC